ncbi:MAG: hypothetical protein OZ948_16915 [Deltaproteobacteria bacterium]|nr:hypothetical protein [Deltaproteobacteria bacterium]
MRIPAERMLAAVSQALLEQVLPHVEARAARSQLYAAVEVLRNLERRLEWARAPLAAEAASIEAVLRDAAEALREAGEAGLAARLADPIAGWPEAPEARVEAARAALTAAFVALDAASPPAAGAVCALLGGHLAAQAIRDLAPLAQGSLLEEISRG